MPTRTYRKSKVTLRDVASLADVSEAAVSLVINSKQYHRVSPGVRHKIERCAATLGYTPNRQAQRLVRGKTMTVGVVVTDLTNPFYAHYVHALERELQPHGYVVIPAENRGSDERERELFEMIAGRMCDAIISVELTAGAREGLSELPIAVRAESYPGREPELPGVVHVDVNFGPATDQMFRHFESQGCSKIGLVMDQRQSLRAAARSPRGQHFSESIAGSSVWRGDYAEAAVDEGGPLAAWYDATRDLLRGDPAIDALFIHNIFVAPAVLTAIEDCGRRIGKDVAVATFDDNGYARWLGGGLATVHEDVQAVAGHLVNGLLRRLGADVDPSSASMNGTFRKTVVDSRFSLRASAMLR